MTVDASAGDQSAVRDGDAVGVAREIGEHGFGPAERSLRIDDPFRSSERRQECGERIGSIERGVCAEEGKLAGVVGGEQPLDHEKQAR